jgi:hypothetical protein
MKSYNEFVGLCEEEENRHEAAIKKLNDELKKLQSECKHENTKYWPDPWHSYYECLDCGSKCRRGKNNIGD